MYGRYRSHGRTFDRYRLPTSSRDSYGRHRDRTNTTTNVASGNRYYYGQPRIRPTPGERDSEIIRREHRTLEGNEREGTIPKPEPKPEAPKEELSKELHVKSIDLRVKDNVERHHTDKYSCTKDKNDEGEKQEPRLVIRRGEPFKITITFDRPYDRDKNELKLSFSIGPSPLSTKNTLAVFQVDETGKNNFGPNEWGATLLSQKENELSVDIHVPANCIVGEWELKVTTSIKGKDKEGKDTVKLFTYEHADDIIILFNPWCKDDTVYMSTDKLLDEYILNDTGVLFRGTSYQIGSRPWIYGQFSDDILEVSLHLLRKVFKGEISRVMADPIQTSRGVAQIVNVNDEGGVLIGNWSGDYSDGVSPSNWVGSTKILRQYKQTGKPVKYGQCWVFSGVTTTVCRALGIPCRSVTNFDSAHDADQSVTIDVHYKIENGMRVRNDKLNSDSVWNFHVWNEAWMQRPDLKDGYDGWQVIDATPQETSSGVYTCGPCPLNAIKNGECNIGYDSGFVFAEVNADRVHWVEEELGIFKVFKVETGSIGNKISTKLPEHELAGMDTFERRRKEREDITHLYKYPEGTSEERRAVLNANRTAVRPKEVYDKYLTEGSKDVDFEVKLEDGILVGNEFHVLLKCTNKKDKDRTVQGVYIRLVAVKYTGELLTTIKDIRLKDVTLKGGQGHTYDVSVKPEEYLDKLVEQAQMVIDAVADVKETDQIFCKTSIFRLRRPDIVVKDITNAVVGEAVEVEISVTNPLPRPLTGCVLSIESPALKNVDDLKISDIKAKAEFHMKIKTTAIRAGQAHVAVSLDCQELPDITGEGHISVKAP
ncbi:hypothetical protein CHS0354_012819 [Potamilus streckersoni]|uniref:protein-glutamine gamma-glutamyltransferase n=1 Tax=Potamilus streckersoni TaxID=2493646 RepID=A0AAE0SW50_9BIVA|nr:hypothetical protein CHS0354_012819 [Potamilus streckersoni]